MEGMGATEVAVIFLVVGLGLCAAEIAAPGLVLLPFGVGALLASLTGFVGAALQGLRQLCLHVGLKVQKQKLLLLFLSSVRLQCGPFL